MMESQMDQTKADISATKEGNTAMSNDNETPGIILTIGLRDEDESYPVIEKMLAAVDCPNSTTIKGTIDGDYFHCEGGARSVWSMFAGVSANGGARRRRRQFEDDGVVPSE
jgi:hypothetical protein